MISLLPTVKDDSAEAKNNTPSANDLALQGALQLNNFFDRKVERAINGKAGH